jgi:hypothetical protein
VEGDVAAADDSQGLANFGCQALIKNGNPRFQIPNSIFQIPDLKSQIPCSKTEIKNSSVRRYFYRVLPFSVNHIRINKGKISDQREEKVGVVFSKRITSKQLRAET